MSVVLFTGGCRSGKSALAQQWTEQHGRSCVYLATASVHDDEMAARVAAHQATRGSVWNTLELAAEPDPLDLPSALTRVTGSRQADGHAVLIDCTTLWLAGLMMHGLDDQAIVGRVNALCSSLQQSAVPVALVHNETGWGIVPDNALGRRFRDVSGLMGQRLAAVCNEVILAVCGLPVVVKKGSP